MENGVYRGEWTLTKRNMIGDNDTNDKMTSASAKGVFVAKMRTRTKQFGLMAIRIFQELPRSGEAKIIGNQFLRSSLSVGANYRAVCRARSKAEFYAKLSITVEEADETLFWVEILIESEIVAKDKISKFEAEGHEIIAILSAARSNTK
jgi:four helix bundle protein